jgi:hypothetical protein
MALTDVIVLIFIVTCFAVFMATLGWASRLPRPAGKRLAPQVSAPRLIRDTGNYSASH